MDLSALIFVALAVAWAVYLIPKALKHHEIDRVSRSVESFSDRVRVLARREPVSADRAALVVGSSGTTKPAATALDESESDPVEDAADEDEVDAAEVVAPAPLSRAQLRARKLAAARAAQRRRRVLGTIVSATLAVVALAAFGAVGWAWVAIPATLLVAWLVACRLMVRKEHAARAARTAPVRKRRTTLADQAIAEEDAGDNTEEIPAVRAEVLETPADPNGWDPVPVTLPTYVDKAAAGRTVRTIDLDSTGVWSSGRNAADSALAREAEQQRAEQAETEQRRVSGA
ncbi:hypothetical protein D0Z08_28195 [Nocardioides immobilis]|uniref:Uncharacterized protein n=1 Tax=Nocardioides immobilis TaxID=2049295 RepID=A0A417XT98_9ACTN|nr:hypothetical protein [Nocardioides immobilis]RHW23698.1 hypothetical protein D0Z08_28195 [Nocardioides immobilis]